MKTVENKKIQRVFSGVVESNKPNKTIVVKVERTLMHPKYKKQYKMSKKYHVHDEKNQYNVGDIVQFVGSRPISKTKKWRVLYQDK